MTRIPRFRDADEEARYWATRSTADHVSDTEAVAEGIQVGGALRKRVEERLRQRVVTLRLARSTIDHVRRMARRKGLGYQALLRMWILERLEREINEAA
jgi:predicted DNA binding CopG/RHH family protein